MKSFFKYVMAGMLGSILAVLLVILVSVFIIVGVVASADSEVKVKENSVLLLDFDYALAERSGSKPDLQNFEMVNKLGLRDYTINIRKAAIDENIKGIFLELSLLDAGVASVEEIRNALLDFKKSGKFIIAHSDFYTHKSYYLASVADKLYLTPEGEIQFTGLSANITMFKEMLQKIGVQPQIIRHGKFKSAVEPFMLNEISNENREQTQMFIGSIWNSILTGISTQRNISVEQLNLYADSLLIRNDKSALEYKFVDGLLYKDQIYTEIKNLLKIKEKDKIEFMKIDKYNKALNRPKIDELQITSKNKIAIIYANGNIVMGTSDDDQTGSETISKAIRDARLDSTVKAIVLRINSPGGSALASEIIWRETVLAQKVKPLIVSMGDVAASGGYYIACNADTILAQPNTITGSIGVFGLMFNAKELMTKVGLSVSTVKTNDYSDFMNPSRELSAYERDVMQFKVEEIYKTFITHVAQGRGLTVEAVDQIGQGRVWAGADALKIGLVDAIGGLDDAVAIAAKKAGLDKYKIKSFPEKDKYQEIIENLFADAKMSIIENELGHTFYYFKRIKSLVEKQGIQAELPYFIEVN